LIDPKLAGIQIACRFVDAKTFDPRLFSCDSSSNVITEKALHLEKHLSPIDSRFAGILIVSKLVNAKAFRPRLLSCDSC
jgi:hypothetical protein